MKLFINESLHLLQMLTAGGAVLLEPIMMLEVVTDENYLSSILSDLSRRRTVIKNIDTRGTHKVNILKKSEYKEYKLL